MKSNMIHDFYSAPQARIQRSSFNLSFNVKTTADAGLLIPCFCKEVIPGDTFNVSPSFFARLATPAVPIMDNLWLESFFFYVPNRLVWDNWERLCGAKDNPDDSTDYLTPVMKDTSGLSVESVGDYFGLPINVPLHNISALPFRAMNLIWNEWFRCEYLQDSIVVNTDDGPDDWTDYRVLRRTKRPDYFTSALPWPGSPVSIDLPLGTSAPVYGTGLATRYSSSNGVTDSPVLLRVGPSSGSVSARVQSGGNYVDYSGTSFNLAVSTKESGVAPQLYADLSDATAATVDSLRLAFQLQKLLYRDGVGGMRFKELLLSHFGVVSPDARLQRPEYLGGSSTRINISPIAQTSSTNSTTPQGNLAAIGVAGDRYHCFTKSFVEHGYVIGFFNIRADLSYQQGVDRMWTKQTRFDYFWPVLCMVGDQPIYLKEIFAGTSDDDTVFGYQERYSEYKFNNSLICGKFRSAYAQSLDVWHLAQYFDSAPTLSSDFIEDKPPIERVVAVTDEPQFLVDIYYNFSGVRPMPTYSVPGLIDHF